VAYPTVPLVVIVDTGDVFTEKFRVALVKLVSFDKSTRPSV
jgi:hypothetical protein